MKKNFPIVIKHVVAGFAVALQALLALSPMPAAAQEQPANSRLNADFLHAVAKGDVKKIRALAKQGASVDLPRSVLDIENLQANSEGYTYTFKPATLVGGSRAMLDAIESARAESVRALLDLGADAKTEFFVEADLGVPIPAEVFASAIRNGLSVNVGGATSARVVNDHVVSSVRPTPATKATYLSVAMRLLSSAKNAKTQREMKEIVDMLRQAGAREVSARLQYVQSHG